MKKNRYQGLKNLETVYFASLSEDTLPTRETVLEEIEKCIPVEYSIEDHTAQYFRPLWMRYTVRYRVDKVDANRYKVSVWYDEDQGILQILALIAAVFVGGSLGNSYFADNDGLAGWAAIIGAFICVCVVSFIIGRTKTDVVSACDAIVTGLKEYERAHLLGLGK